MSTLTLIDSRDHPALLWAVLDLVEEPAFVSLEGDLSAYKIAEISGASDQPTPALPRQTLDPKLDFHVLPITDEVIAELKSRLSRSGVFGDGGDLIHVQVSQGDRRIFLACDNFHPECTGLDHPNAPELIRRWAERGLVRGSTA